MANENRITAQQLYDEIKAFGEAVKTRPSQMSLESDTASQRSSESDTASQMSLESDTASQMSLESDTASQMSLESDTASQRSSESDTASQRSSESDTASQRSSESGADLKNFDRFIGSNKQHIDELLQKFIAEGGNIYEPINAGGEEDKLYFALKRLMGAEIEKGTVVHERGIKVSKIGENFELLQGAFQQIHRRHVDIEGVFDDAAKDRLLRIKLVMEHASTSNQYDISKLKNQENKTILEKAVEHGNNTMLVNQLINMINMRNEHGNNTMLVNSPKQTALTALHAAVAAGNDKMVRALLKADANINAVNESGQTALHAAVAAGNDKMVRALLKAGANPFLRDKEGQTVYAVAQGGGEIAKMLLNASEKKFKKRAQAYQSSAKLNPYNTKKCISDVIGVLQEAHGFLPNNQGFILLGMKDRDRGEFLARFYHNMQVSYPEERYNKGEKWWDNLRDTNKAVRKVAILQTLVDMTDAAILKDAKGHNIAARDVVRPHLAKALQDAQQEGRTAFTPVSKTPVSEEHAPHFEQGGLDLDGLRGGVGDGDWRHDRDHDRDIELDATSEGPSLASDDSVQSLSADEGSHGVQPSGVNEPEVQPGNTAKLVAQFDGKVGEKAKAAAKGTRGLVRGGSKGSLGSTNSVRGGREWEGKTPTK